jgi:hypothetical protein
MMRLQALGSVDFIAEHHATVSQRARMHAFNHEMFNYEMHPGESWSAMGTGPDPPADNSFPINEDACGGWLAIETA